MLRPKKMKRVRVIVLKAAVEKLIKELHEAGVVEITKTKYEALEEGRPLHAFNEISAHLVRLRSILAMMEAAAGSSKNEEYEIISGHTALEEAKKLDMEAKLRALTQESLALSEQIKELESKALVIDRLLQFGTVDFSKLGTRKLGYRVGEASNVDRLKQKIEKIGDSTPISKNGSKVVLVLYDKKDEAGVDVALAEAEFDQIELPEGTTTPFETINRFNAENDDKKARLVSVKKQIVAISEANRGKVKKLVTSLEVESERAGIAARFASSKYAYMLEGWIIAEEYDKLAEIVGKHSKEAMLEDVHFGHHETPPVVLDNPKQAGPFEFLTKSYSLPNYFEIDPTIPYLVALPILYGMIVGDFIYGVISLLLAMWLMKKFAKSYIMYNVSKIWYYSAFPTMLFGLIFDEWGGMSHYHLLEIIGKWIGIGLVHGPLYVGFHRLENVMVLIGITALVGMIHLTAGFVIGAVNEWNHNRKHAYAKIAWIGVEIGGLLALLPAAGLLSGMFTTIGLAILGISVIALALTEGVVGVIEIPGLFGNVLSYMRIAAIGIVGVILAELINEFLIPLPEQGLFAIILLPIFLILHVVNCFIAMFESLIQGGRLNIVEFKSKFLHGGGTLFAPFALKYDKKGD